VISSSQNPILPVRQFHRLAIEYGIVVLAVLTVAILAIQPESLMVVVFVMLVVTAVVKFDWFVYGIIFLLPWYPLPDLNLPVRDVFLVLHLFTFATVAIIRRREGKGIKDWLVGGRVRKAVVAFVLIATVSLLTSHLPPKLDAYRSLARLYSYVALFYAVAGWMDTREKAYRVINTTLISTIIVAIFGFYQSIEGSYTDLYYRLYPLQEASTLEDWSGRITSFLFHFNSLAGYLNLAIPFAIAYTVLASRRSTQILGMTCLCTATVALYLTGSRGGLLAFGAIILFSLVYIRLCFKPHSVNLFRGLVTLIMAAVIALALSPHESEQATRIQSVDEFTQASRLTLWGAAAMMFIEHPALGIGYGNYRSTYNDYLPQLEGDQLDAHEIYLQMLAETGIIGFAVFLVLMGMFLRSGIKLAKQADPFLRIVGLGVGGALVGLLVHGFVDFLFHVSPQFGTLFWVVMGIGVQASPGSLNRNTSEAAIV